MDVTAYDSQGVLPPVVLGAVAEQVWVKGFKYKSARTIQVSKPINAAAPNLYDRLMRLVNFQFAAAVSQSGQFPNGAALAYMTGQDALVPTLANLQFKETADGSNQVAWLLGCGIPEIELVDKAGALVVFGYTIIGGTWSAKGPT